jgi:E3 ubiquitin-protein ligase makorin
LYITIELYFYGAPGDFLQDPDIVDDEEEDKPLYSDIARLNLSKDHQEDDHQPFLYHEEKIAKPKQCTFFLQGKCRYGDICFYSHDFDFQEEDLVTKEEEIQQSKELECNICYDFIIEKNERFGLLSGCNHAFCLKCVRDWRGGEKSDQPKQTIRQCPVCRIETHFIIPSSRMITQPDRKQALIDKYVKNLSAIPCRHFDEGR